MKNQPWILFLVALVLIAGTGGLLQQVRGHQKLGLPGVKAHPLPDSIRLAAELPEHVLDYQSEAVEIDDVTLKTLPPDTSFGYRRYRAADGFGLDLRVVLMGADRTSLHKPQFCLTGQGWLIDETCETNVPIELPSAYNLPIVKLVATLAENGNRTAQRGIYVYWYIADDKLSASALGIQRMWWMAEKLIRTGVLQRWAYVSCFAPCAPGQEEVTFQRIGRFLAASVPQFQLYPQPPGHTLSAQR